MLNTALRVLLHLCTRWHKKVSHYQEFKTHHEIVLKTASAATFLICFKYKMSTRMLKVCIRYAMCDLICGVISCCV